MKKSAIHFLFILLFLTNVEPAFSQEEITKQYYNNIFSGGKERIFSIKDDIKNIIIKSAFIDITLYKEHSEITATYKIINKGNNTEFYWAYPMLDAKITKAYEPLNNKAKKQRVNKIKGEYVDYQIFVNNEKANYSIQEGKELEIGCPFKIGDTITSIKNKKIIYDEAIDSCFYSYSWYVTPIKTNEDEEILVKISYKSPHYYNTIAIKNREETPISHLYEDPALKYYSTKKRSTELSVSEKIFTYNFHTAYSAKEKSIKRVYIKLTANIINQKYLKIMPRNYKKKGKRYYWKYKNFNAKPLNNLLIKISPNNSKNTISPFCFETNINKKKDELISYYELDKTKDSLILTFHDFNEKEKVLLSRIKIIPEYFNNNENKLLKINKPLKFQIEFSDNLDFQNSKVFITEFSLKKILKSIKKKYYLTIFKEDEIKCKFIKIKILKTTNEDDIIRISDIEILK